MWSYKSSNTDFSEPISSFIWKWKSLSQPLEAMTPSPTPRRCNPFRNCSYLLWILASSEDLFTVCYFVDLFLAQYFLTIEMPLFKKKKSLPPTFSPSATPVRNTSANSIASFWRWRHQDPENSSNSGTLVPPALLRANNYVGWKRKLQDWFKERWNPCFSKCGPEPAAQLYLRAC
jgi:hypothetical protein